MRFLLVLACLLFLSVVRAETIRVGLQVEIKELDPYDLSYVEEFEVFYSVHDTLLNYQPLTGLTPVLAERWEFDNQKKTTTIHLKKGLTFSDGSELSVKDVEYTLKRLLFLDKSNNLTITQCLMPKSKKIKNINQDVPVIRTVGKYTIVLGPTDCAMSLIKRLSDPNYGIISKDYIGKDFKLKPGAATSGAFNYRKNFNGFSLVPNKKNWRWKNPGIKDVTYDFFIIDQDFKSIAKNKIDIFRTTRHSVLDEALKNGYSNIVSIPVMVWFIVGEHGHVEKTLPILNALNSNIEKRNYKVFNNNALEVSATNFLPNEFNCKNIGTHIVSGTIVKKGLVRIHNHKSGESKIFIDDLKKDLESHGVTVLIDNEKSNSKEKPINLYMERQFFDDSIHSTLDFAYRIFKTIPDPQEKILKTIKKLDEKNLSRKDEMAFLKTLCNDQYLFNHTPLAYRKYAFVYKNERLKPIFFKGSGNLIFNEVIK